MKVKNMVFNKSVVVTATSTAQKIISKVDGNRDVLQIQNQSDNKIGIAYSKEDSDADIFYTINKDEWLFFDNYIMQNDIYIKSFGESSRVVYTINQAEK